MDLGNKHMIHINQPIQHTFPLVTKPFIFSLINLAKREPGSLHNVERVVQKILPPTLSLIHCDKETLGGFLQRLLSATIPVETLLLECTTLLALSEEIAWMFAI